MAVVTRTRRYPFQSVHALHVGLHRERLHGHGFQLEVSVRASRSQSDVDREVQARVLNTLHAHELKLNPATGENLVNWIHERLQDALGDDLMAICLQETRKNRFISAASEARFV